MGSEGEKEKVPNKPTDTDDDHECERRPSSAHQRKTWGSRMEDENGEDSEEEETHTKQQRSRSLIYVGNIPPYYQVEDLCNIFGIYIKDPRDVSITKQVHKGKEISLYAIINIDEEDATEILNFNNLTVGGKQIVIERARKNPNGKEGAKENDGAYEKKKTRKDRKGNNIQCKFYLQGRCTKQQCEYEHRDPCKFYAKGHCKYFENCKYAHFISKNNGKPQMGGNDLLSAILKAIVPQLSDLSPK